MMRFPGSLPPSSLCSAQARAQGRARARAAARAKASAQAAPRAALWPSCQRRAQIDLSDALRRRLSVLSSELKRFVFAMCSGAVPNAHQKRRVPGRSRKRC